MGMKKIVLIMLLMFAGMEYGWCNCLMADTNPHETHNRKAEKERIIKVRKALDQARVNIKKGSNLENTEKQMRELLKDSANQRIMPLRLTLCEAIAKQYESGNEKLFLKEKYDTAALFNIAQRMFLAYNELDSMDAKPDNKGVVTLKYRRSNAAMLARYHKNLYSGGIFYLNHQKYKEAWSIIDTYLSAYEWPLFSSDKIKKDSLMMSHAAYISLISGYLCSDFQKALKYEDMVLSYTPKHESILECLSEIYYEKEDLEQYEKYLRLGLESYPKSTYFFSYLIEYYNNYGMSQKAMSLVDEMTAKDSTNILFMKVKQVLLLNKGRYDECISLGNSIIALDDSIPDVYYNVALAIYNQSLVLEEDASLKTREKKKQMNEMYRKCLPYIEKYRAMKPEEKDKWMPILYTIYLNLNMGKEFDEILKLKQ